ncbi:microtubule-actin cross-linking factor 1, isoforms 6/7-like [Tautogolabrus adspersus]
MGKPLSRPDCLRQNPRCLGKGDEEEAYIEDCYVPQRSIYDTMRINEQIDQGTKLCQPSRSTLGSGGEVRGEGSTLSSNGTIGAELGGVFVPRNADNAGGLKRLDERVIFDALKLTGDAQIMSPPVAIVGSGLQIAPSSSGSGVAAAVAKRRHQGGDKRDNPNRRSWKAFMPPSYPEFAERLEFSSNEGAEKRTSGAGIPLSPLQVIPSHLPPRNPYLIHSFLTSIHALPSIICSPHSSCQLLAFNDAHS